MAQHPYCVSTLKINWWFIRFFTLALLDFLGQFLHLPPLYVPLVGPPGKPAIFGPAAGALEGFRSVTQNPRHVYTLNNIHKNNHVPQRLSQPGVFQRAWPYLSS
jgi:hypothetical protein